MCFDVVKNFCLTYLSFRGELSELLSKVCVGLHVKYPLCLSGVVEVKFSCQIF